jgi:two-component system sensor histidine kinase HydH
VINDKGQKPVFEVAAVFQSLPTEQPPAMGMMGHSDWRQVSRVTKMLEEGRAVIHLGLCTKEFQEARARDVRHSFFMGSLLLLLGSAGFYFLFLYQGMRVTRTTLANMKLYTRNIIESMPDGLITFDSAKRVVAWNPKAVELTGRDHEELKGLSMTKLFPGLMAESLAAVEKFSSFSYVFKNNNEGEIPVEISCSPLQDEEKKHRGAVFLLRDLRKIRAMEEQLARSHRLAALGKMAAGIAHEIRNPLGTLRGFAQYFGSKSEDDASREYSSLMIGEVDRLNESISSLLQFSRPREPEYVSLDPVELLDKMAKLLEYDLKEKNITLEKVYNCSAQIEGDGDLLLQVLLNVLKNGLNASEMDGIIYVSCENDDENLYITVKDHGAGMSRAECEQMFDPFFTTRKTGTGLGLTVSHQIVEQHRGHFRVASEPGKGTSVTVVLPIRQREL